MYWVVTTKHTRIPQKSKLGLTLLNKYTPLISVYFLLFLETHSFLIFLIMIKVCFQSNTEIANIPFSYACSYTQGPLLDWGKILQKRQILYETYHIFQLKAIYSFDC